MSPLYTLHHRTWVIHSSRGQCFCRICSNLNINACFSWRNTQVSVLPGQVVTPLERWSAMKVSRPWGPQRDEARATLLVMKQNREGEYLSEQSYEISRYKMSCSQGGRLAKRDAYEISRLLYVFMSGWGCGGFLCLQCKQVKGFTADITASMNI